MAKKIIIKCDQKFLTILPITWLSCSGARGRAAFPVPLESLSQTNGMEREVQSVMSRQKRLKAIHDSP